MATSAGAPLQGRALAAPRGSIPPAVFEQVSCPTATRCVAVGYDADGFVPVVSVNGGSSWSRPTVVVPWPSYTPPPGTQFDGVWGSVTGLSCNATLCVAVGLLMYAGATNPIESLVMVSHNAGKSWGALHTLAGLTGLNHVACASAKVCIVDGSATGASPSEDLLYTTTNGATSWGLADWPGVPGGGLTGFSNAACVGGGCQIVPGWQVTGSPTRLGFGLASGGMHRWSVNVGWTDSVLPSPVPPDLSTGYSAFAVGALACPAVEYCVLGGSNDPNDLPGYGDASDAVLRSVDNGRSWSIAATPAVPASVQQAGGWIQAALGLACPTTRICVLVGGASAGLPSVLVSHDGASSFQPGPVAKATGTATPAGDVRVYTAVACPTTHRCVVVGDSIPDYNLALLRSGRLMPSPGDSAILPYTGVVSV